jgi:hypothetical protein
VFRKSTGRGERKRWHRGKNNKEVDQSTDFVKKLLSLARKGNADLTAVFESSYEGKAFNVESFDKKFFIDNAKEVVEEQSKA